GSGNAEPLAGRRSIDVCSGSNRVGMEPELRRQRAAAESTDPLIGQHVDDVNGIERTPAQTAQYDSHWHTPDRMRISESEPCHEAFAMHASPHLPGPDHRGQTGSFGQLIASRDEKNIRAHVTQCAM